MPISPRPCQAQARLSLVSLAKLRQLRARTTVAQLSRALHINASFLPSLVQDGGPAQAKTIARLQSVIDALWIGASEAVELAPVTIARVRRA